jgi:Beta-lactamase class C and other penicillin binding proteins
LYNAIRSRSPRKGNKKIMVIVISIVLFVALVVGGLMIFGKIQMGKVPGLSFEDALKYTTHSKKDAKITVGIIKDGKSSFTVYGADAQVLSSENHIYEIGSLTKTMTAALISKAASEGKLSLNSTIDAYLPLSEGNNYPTIAELVTHTSGYNAWYFETPMIGNFFAGRNSFCGISRDIILEKTKKLDMNRDSYGFTYSNFGYAVLGLVLEAVYDKDYTTLLNEYVQKELGMTATKISERDGDLGNYWDWQKNDGYLSAGAVTSNINDMMRYAQMQLDENAVFAMYHKSIKSIDASSESYKTMGIYMDEIGMAWIIDRKNGIIWHNGGTGNYNSYLGFSPDSGTAVVVLSNLSPNDRIPATVLGIKKLLEIK